MFRFAKELTRGVLLYGLLTISINLLSEPLPGLDPNLARPLASGVVAITETTKEFAAQTIAGLTSPELQQNGAKVLRAIHTSAPVRILTEELRAMLRDATTRRA